MHETAQKIERVIAISVVKKGADRELALEYLDELAFLAETAGAEVIQKVYQELAKPSASTVLGKGKVQEVKEMIEENEINLVIFDDDLSPAQVKNLGRELNVKVMDRSGIILDIFASRAKSLEAKTQVELAQLQYMLPRLTRLWTHLSKLYGGGIGTRGPGETQIETDRRLIRERIQLLKSKLKDISVQKEQQRKGRESMPRFALVGYTNAGKSTLMNVLTQSDVYVEDKLFATLDTTVRAFELPGAVKALLSDTVGFIRKLPTHLIASFRSTLAEAAEAEILVHVVDISNPFFREHIGVVENTLESLNIINKPVILVFNKIDMLDSMEGMKVIEKEFPDSILVSAKRGINIQTMLELFKTKYDENSNVVKILLPYTQMDLIAKLYSSSEVLKREDKDEGIEFELRLQDETLSHFNHYFNDFKIL